MPIERCSRPLWHIQKKKIGDIMESSRWKYNIIYDLEIKVKTGLHIGGTNEEIKIGGIDNQVITTSYEYNNKMYDLPYIPGSSIKGKLRSILSAFYQNKEIIEKVFGRGNNEKDNIDRRTRLIVRDFYLTEDEIKNYVDNDFKLTEIKGENIIDPLTSKATPRFIERIKPGTVFEGKFILSIYEDDDEEAMTGLIMDGLELIRDSYLGGNGSRGYGSVEIYKKQQNKKGIKDYEGNNNDSIQN